MRLFRKLPWVRYRAQNEALRRLVMILRSFYHDFDGGELAHSNDHRGCEACDALCEAVLGGVEW